MSASDSPDGIQKTFDAGYQECLSLYESEKWEDAARASKEFVAWWITSTALSLESRELFAGVMWMACHSEAAESWDQTGVTSQAALDGIDDLIDWVRTQPEVEFRAMQAHTLRERMRWYGNRHQGLDSLEELVEVLADLDDSDVTKDVVSRLITELPGSLYISGEDQLRYDDGAITLLDEGDPAAVDPDEIGAADTVFDLSDRAADALSALANCLDEGDDPRATELRATVLLWELAAVGKLGNEERAQARFETFASLGAAAVAACDARAEIVGNSDGRASRVLIGLLMTKATVLHINEEDDTALVVLTEAIDRFDASEDPTIAAMVGAARELQADLLDESDADID